MVPTVVKLLRAVHQCDRSCNSNILHVWISLSLASDIFPLLLDLLLRTLLLCEDIFLPISPFTLSLKNVFTIRELTISDFKQFYT